jgi:hypothetical protein
MHLRHYGTDSHYYTALSLELARTSFRNRFDANDVQVSADRAYHLANCIGTKLWAVSLWSVTFQNLPGNIAAVRHVRPGFLPYMLFAQRMFSVVDGAEVPVDPGTILRTKLDSVLQKSAGVLLAIAGTSIMRPLAASALDGGGVTQTTAVGTTTPAPAQDPVMDLGPPPSDYGLVENDYYGDAAKVCNSSTGSRAPSACCSSLVCSVDAIGGSTHEVRLPDEQEQSGPAAGVRSLDLLP